MKTPHRFALAVLLVCTAAHAAEPDAVRRLPFHGSVQVDADGRMRVEQLEGVHSVLADAVRSQVEARHARPAWRDGKAVATTAPLSGTVVLTPGGDRLDVDIERLTLQPGALQRHPISYPVDAMRNESAGWAEVEFALNDRGMPIDIRTVATSEPIFAKAVTPPLSQWRFSTHGVEAGQHHRMTFRFDTDHRTATPAFECAVDASRASVDGQDGCIDAIRVHGSRVRRAPF